MSPRKKGKRTPAAVRAPAVPKPLTPRQLRYCEEFLVDLNQTQAAIRSGYSARSAKVTASELMDNPRIQAEVARLQLLRAERTQITADRVIAELGILAFSDLGDYGEWEGDRFTFCAKLFASKDIPPDKRRAIASLSGRATRSGYYPEIKLHSKDAALTALCRHFGLFKDKTEVSMSRETILALMTQVAGVIERVIPDPELLAKIEEALSALAGKQ